MIQPALFSSASDDWATPPALFAELDAVHWFTLDVCASAENAKCARYFDMAADGLSQDWGKHHCWMNPPYGRTIGRWVKKAYEESLKGALVMCLLPARTDTAWWHDYCVRGEVTFLRGRLKFGNAKTGAPFPSALVLFKPHQPANVENTP